MSLAPSQEHHLRADPHHAAVAPHGPVAAVELAVAPQLVRAHPLREGPAARLHRELPCGILAPDGMDVLGVVPVAPRLALVDLAGESDAPRLGRGDVVGDPHPLAERPEVERPVLSLRGVVGSRRAAHRPVAPRRLRRDHAPLRGAAHGVVHGLAAIAHRHHAHGRRIHDSGHRARAGAEGSNAREGRVVALPLQVAALGDPVARVGVERRGEAEDRGILRTQELLRVAPRVEGAPPVLWRAQHVDNIAL
mmetsp:Transcript_46660/g.137864  ORF Transcript_46660/g.137864 Transcript_46660/m.137864 type:complete len:250 (+) Transcript_46660:45-794(+)